MEEAGLKRGVLSALYVTCGNVPRKPGAAGGRCGASVSTAVDAATWRDRFSGHPTVRVGGRLELSPYEQLVDATAARGITDLSRHRHGGAIRRCEAAGLRAAP